MAPPPPPPPPPPPHASGYANAGGGYYSSNAGSTSSSAARQRLGLSNNKQTTGASSDGGDWFASAPAPSNAMAAAAAPAPPPAAASSSGFYSTNTGGSNDNMYSNYGASNPNPYGGSSNAMSAGTSSSGGGYYGSSSGGGGGGYAGSTNNTMSGAMGGGGGGYASSSTGAMSGAIGGTPTAIPPASAFGSNPNSGSSNQMNSGGGGNNTFEMGGAMGGPIGGNTITSATSTAPAPHVFDPSAAAKQTEGNKLNAMAPTYEEDYDNEPPLLEELGVNFPHIYSKSRAVLFPIGKHARSLESGLIENDADLAGPLAFALGLGGELLLSGKLHFGYVYGFGVSGCLAMTLLLNLLNPNGAVSIWTVVSIMGYALLPVNLLAGVNAIVRIHSLGKWGMLASILTIAWCTTASARLFERGCNMRAQRFLVAYPTALLYSAFVMITIF